MRVCACRNAGGDYAICSEPAHVALRIECVHASAGVMLSGGRRGTCCEGSACTICNPKTRHASAVDFAKKTPMTFFPPAPRNATPFFYNKAPIHGCCTWPQFLSPGQRPCRSTWPQAVPLLLAIHLRTRLNNANAESSSSLREGSCVDLPAFHDNAAIADWTTARSTCNVMPLPAKSCKKRSVTLSACCSTLHTG